MTTPHRRDNRYTLTYVTARRIVCVRLSEPAVALIDQLAATETNGDRSAMIRKLLHKAISEHTTDKRQAIP